MGNNETLNYVSEEVESWFELSTRIIIGIKPGHGLQLLPDDSRRTLSQFPIISIIHLFQHQNIYLP